MDLQTMGDKAVTSENVPSIDNLRAHSPQTADVSRRQPAPTGHFGDVLKPPDLGSTFVDLMVALAPNIPVVLLGWCIAQLSFNALLAAMVAVLPDQVPAAQRGMVAGVLGVCVPIASASGTFVVKIFTGNQLAMFLAPCAIGGFFILLFAATLKDRRLAKADKPPWSMREFARTFYVNPRKSPRSLMTI